jgi:signal transduction histidine kinase
VDLAAFRIVQESLTNVLRHASARRVVVSVRRAGSSVEIRVTDDGTAQPCRGTGGHGLAGMRERAAAYGGTISAGPRPEGGWEVHAVLPVPAESPTPSDDEVPA